MSVTRSTEIRKLPETEKSQLSGRLDKNKAWEKLMEFIPKNLADLKKEGVNLNEIERKYTTEHIE